MGHTTITNAPKSRARHYGLQAAIDLGGDLSLLLATSASSVSAPLLPQFSTVRSFIAQFQPRAYSLRFMIVLGRALLHRCEWCEWSWSLTVFFH